MSEATVVFHDDGGDLTRVHTSIEFTEAVLRDEKAFRIIVIDRLIEALREGKNVLVTAPKKCTEGVDGAGKAL